MKTLVTGATGFIGKHLVKTLVEKERDLRCLVRKTSDTQYLKNIGVELVYGELLNKDSLKNIAKDVDIVYHLAGEIYSQRSRDFYKVNFYGTKNLVGECFSKNIKKFVYLSSIAAVGPNQKLGILLDEQSPCRPLDPYGKSKLHAEKLLIRYFEQHAYPAVIIRAPTVYGPLGKSKMMKKLVDRIYTGRFLMLGNGTNVRSMCYIDNLIQALIEAERSGRALGEIFFVADEKTYTYNEIFQTVAQEVGTILEKTQLPACLGSISGFLFKTFSLMGFYSIPLYMAWHMVLDMACDISKAKEQLHYIPRIGMKKGMKKTIKYYLGKNAI